MATPEQARLYEADRKLLAAVAENLDTIRTYDDARGACGTATAQTKHAYALLAQHDDPVLRSDLDTANQALTDAYNRLGGVPGDQEIPFEVWEPVRRAVEQAYIAAVAVDGYAPAAAELEALHGTARDFRDAAKGAGEGLGGLVGPVVGALTPLLIVLAILVGVWIYLNRRR